VNAAAQMPLLHDDFGDDAIDPTRWTASADPTLVISETNQRVEISIPASASQYQTRYGYGASYGSKCAVRGDFDIQVRFQLPTWPAGSGVRVGLGAGMAVERDSFSVVEGGPWELYLTDGPNSI